MKHQEAFNQNPRTRLMTANLSKIGLEDQKKIQIHAKSILDRIDSI